MALHPPALAGACQDAGDSGVLIGRLIIADASAWVAARIATERQITAPSRRADTLTEQAAPLAAILRAADILDLADISEQTAELLGDDPRCSAARSRPSAQRTARERTRAPPKGSRSAP